MLENSSSNSGTSVIVAYIGAVTGSAALVWNLVKHFLDNRVKLVVHVVESYVGDDKTEIRAEIFNNGSSAVTIRDVFLEAYNSKNNRQRYGVGYQLKDPSIPMPTKLEVGGNLVVAVEMDDSRMWHLAKNHNLAIAVQHSRSKKPLVKFYESIFLSSD